MSQKRRIDFELRKEMILTSVSDVFAEKGLSATTKELSKAAGVSEALLYKHFNSKVELFEEVKKRCCNQVHSYAEKIHTVNCPLQRLVISVLLLNYTALVGFQEDAVEKKQIHRLMLQSLSSSGDFALQMFSNFGRWVEHIAEDVKLSRKEGYLFKLPITDEKLVWMIHHFVLGVALTRVPDQKLSIFDQEPKKLVREISTQSLVMLGMSHEKAKSSISEVLKAVSKTKEFKILKEWL